MKLSRSLKFLFALLGFFFILYFSLPHPPPLIPSGALHLTEQERTPIRLFVLGDTGTGDENQYAVGKAMEARCTSTGSAQGILLLGDNFYQHGVDSVDDPDWEKKFNLPYNGNCLKEIPFFALPGNHDYKGNVQAQIDYGKINTRWHMPYRFFTVTWGNLLKVVFFDTMFPDLCFSQDGNCALNFLYSEFLTPNEPKTKWTLTAAHQPLASASMLGYNYTGRTLYAYLLRKFLCDKTDAYLSGHAHHLEHRREEDCAADLWIAGGGGGELKPFSTDIQSKFIASKFGFMEIEITEEKIVSRFIDITGNVLYESVTPSKPLKALP